MKLNIPFALLCLAAAACTCGQPPSKPTLLHEGEPCIDDDRCETGLCDALPDGTHQCLRKCSSGCRTDEICEKLSPDHFACVPDKGGLCRACQVDSDCPYPADKCLKVGAEQVCGRDCAFDQQCPTSYQCVNGIGPDGKARAQQCVPFSGSCLCTAASAGQMISCEVENPFGKCLGHKTCDGLMGYGACDARTPTNETCNGLDDDCDGATDENQGVVSCGMGLCARTVNACTMGSPTQCMPGAPDTERCNGLDDDCDGVNDNGFDLTTNVSHCGMCNKACMLDNATPRCEASTCKVATCLGTWGNCDHVDSNGCETDLKQDENNCNACGTRCMFPGAMGRCTNGTCGFTCLQGFIDLDMQPGNGCEYQCTFQSATDLPDLQFVDANCDGIDGEVGNGIFVAPVAAGGNDANAGTRAAPKATVSSGLAAAAAQGKRDVYVSGGTYLGQLSITALDGRNVAGGYAFPDWKRSLINTTTFTGASPALKVSASDGGTLQLLTVLGSNASGASATAYGAWIEGSAGLRLEGLTLSAGQGADGVDGARGNMGPSGGNGGLGDRGCTNDPAFAPFLCTTCAQPPAGAVGASACSESGGAGGLPGLDTLTAGSSGSPGSGGAAGGAGIPAQGGGAIPGAFANGQDGASGTQGNNGAGASGLGTLGAAGYVRPVAQAGLAGTSGRGGGGGGGGGGGCSNSLLGVFCFCFSYGSSGGGGGAGGCAGEVGLQGESGGASIGLFLWDSSVTALNVGVTTTSGGRGGNGGSGGPGGQGGLGDGSGYDIGQQGNSGRGGRGGNGGTGGRSGHGGGGGGGPSIGVARSAGSSFTPNNVSYTLGQGGLGGTSSGNAGQSGTVSQVQAF